ncbi:MAG: rod-binding protein [Parvularculaceae bacterium]|nr:rod-binding protein [Parvularculaceae bacterium]
MEAGIGDWGLGIGGSRPTAVVGADSKHASPDSRVDAAARDFEAVFIAQMLAPLFSSVETPAIAGGGKSEAFFKSLLQESYAKAMAERGGFGLADHVKASLISLQSHDSPEPFP